MHPIIFEKKAYNALLMPRLMLLFVFFPFQEVTDESDGCGGKFSAIIVSAKFAGKPLLQRHR
jgi:hypothetical protein